MEDQFNKGVQKGLEEGIKKGREEEMEKGERKKQLEIALNLKRAGNPVEQIAMFTGLTLEEIKGL